MNTITKHVFQDWKIDAQQCNEDRAAFRLHFTAPERGDLAMKHLNWILTCAYREFGAPCPAVASVDAARELCASSAMRLLAMQPTRTYADMDRDQLPLYIQLLLCSPEQWFKDSARHYHEMIQAF